MTPVAVTTTPPSAGVVATPWPLACCTCPLAPVSVRIPDSWTYPGWARLNRRAPPVALPAAARRFTTARPVPALAGAAISAIPPPAPPAHPGDAQARVTEVTASDRTGGTAGPPASAMECLTPPSPYRPPRTRITATPRRIRLVRRFLTSPPPRAPEELRSATMRAHHRGRRGRRQVGS